MNLNSISAALGTNSTSSANSSSSPGVSSEANMFMTLLVAQLKNQDPLQPQDGAAFVAQLAQFNSLDQLIGIRQSIDALNVKLQQGEGGTDTSSDKLI